MKLNKNRLTTLSIQIFDILYHIYLQLFRFVDDLYFDIRVYHLKPYFDLQMSLYFLGRRLVAPTSCVYFFIYMNLMYLQNHPKLLLFALHIPSAHNKRQDFFHCKNDVWFLTLLHEELVLLLLHAIKTSIEQ